MVLQWRKYIRRHYYIMRRAIKSTLACVLSVALLAGVCVNTGDSADAAAPKLNKTKLTMKVGGKAVLKVKNSKGKVKWTSSKKKVATVSSKGVVMAKSKGTAIITAKVASKKLKCRVAVNPKKVVKSTKKPVVTASPNPAESLVTPSPVPTQAATPTIAPTASPIVSPTASPVPESTKAPEPTATPEYMQEGAFVYEKLDISWIDPEKPMVAFTFDDGPVGSEDTSNSMRIMAALAKYGYHATFNYVTSKFNSDTNKNEVLAAMEAGHEVANHTSQWGSLSDMKDGETIAAEIEKGRAALEELTGMTTFTLRPPNLGTNDMVLENCNVPLINCNIYSNDWESGTTKEQIIEKVKAAKDGDIVLMHETNPDTAAAVEEELVEYFHEKGFQIVSVVELFAAKDIPLFPGVLYSKAEYKEARK